MEYCTKTTPIPIWDLCILPAPGCFRHNFCRTYVHFQHRWPGAVEDAPAVYHFQLFRPPYATRQGKVPCPLEGAEDFENLVNIVSLACPVLSVSEFVVKENI